LTISSKKEEKTERNEEVTYVWISATDPLEDLWFTWDCRWIQGFKSWIPRWSFTTCALQKTWSNKQSGKNY
jgi:hypothetical protein